MGKSGRYCRRCELKLDSFEFDSNCAHVSRRCLCAVLCATAGSFLAIRQNDLPRRSGAMTVPVVILRSESSPFRRLPPGHFESRAVLQNRAICISRRLSGSLKRRRSDASRRAYGGIKRAVVLLQACSFAEAASAREQAGLQIVRDHIARRRACGRADPTPIAEEPASVVIHDGRRRNRRHCWRGGPPAIIGIEKRRPGVPFSRRTRA